MRPTACLLVLLAWGVPAAALAQDPDAPLPPIVLDVRGFYAGLGQDPITASELGVAATELPGRALGGVVGIHAYPLRGRSFAIGVGADFMLARGRATRDAEDDPVQGPPIEQRLESLSGSLSLNFGQREGWSYLSAGMGPMRFGTFVGETAPAERAPRRSTIHMGGGARWFAARHLAVTFDLRFYLTRPEVTTASYPGRQRNRLLVLSGGIAIK
jgi:hypothetical protein